jgi:hypothetical protein
MDNSALERVYIQMVDYNKLLNALEEFDLSRAINLSLISSDRTQMQVISKALTAD